MGGHENVPRATSESGRPPWREKAKGGRIVKRPGYTSPYGKDGEIPLGRRSSLLLNDDRNERVTNRPSD